MTGTVSRRLLAEQAGFEELCFDLRQERVIGLDVETTISRTPLLCTVQIATSSGTWIVDALAVDDISPLAGVLEDPGIVKVIHYADFERRVLARYGIEIHNVFDTCAASRRCRKAPSGAKRLSHSLLAVCRRELGITLDKFFQKSDWTRRPLSRGQLEYAAMDAEVLLDLYEIFNGDD